MIVTACTLLLVQLSPSPSPRSLSLLSLSPRLLSMLSLLSLLSPSHNNDLPRPSPTNRKTGIVYNVTKTSVGVIVNKQVGNRFMEKRVNLRVEHVKHSKCRDDFLKRVKSNLAKKQEAKKLGGRRIDRQVS